MLWCSPRATSLHASPLGLSPRWSRGQIFPTRICGGVAEMICPPGFSFLACPAQGARRRARLTPGIRGAQEARVQPVAGFGWLREGICWPRRPVCPWAGGHTHLLPGWAKRGAMDPSFPMDTCDICAPRGWHQSEGFLGDVLGGFLRWSPAELSDRLRVQAHPAVGLGHGCFAQGPVPGAQAWDASSMAHSSLETSWMPQQLPGNCQLLLVSPPHRGPLQDCPHTFSASSA